MGLTMVKVKELKEFNDEWFYTAIFRSYKTEELPTYSGYFTKKWCKTDIENLDIIVEDEFELAPVEYDPYLNKTGMYEGMGVYIIKEYNFSNPNHIGSYINVLLRLRENTRLHSIRDEVNRYIEFLHDVVEKEKNFTPFKLILVKYIPYSVFKNKEYVVMDGIVIYIDRTREKFMDKKLIRECGEKIHIEIEILSKKPEKYLTVDGIQMHIETKPNKDEYIRVNYKDKEGYDICSYIVGVNENLTLKAGMSDNAVSLRTQSIFNAIEKTLMKFKDMAIEVIKLQEKLLEMFVAEMKAIYAENKVAQAAFNRLKEKVALEKEEISKNKELVRIAKEVFEKV